MIRLEAISVAAANASLVITSHVEGPFFGQPCWQPGGPREHEQRQKIVGTGKVPMRRGKTVNFTGIDKEAGSSCHMRGMLGHLKIRGLYCVQPLYSPSIATTAQGCTCNGIAGIHYMTITS
eukprot:1138014-Pelagomonas_calceolata.AAC.8